MPLVRPLIADAVASMGPGPLQEASLRRCVFPLFSRVLARRELYLANHSLGRPLDVLADDVREALDLWYGDMDEAWGAWLEEQQAFRGRVAALIGCSRPDAVVPKTAAGQGLRAVLNAIDVPTPHVLATHGEFDSLDFILRTYAERGRASVRWLGPQPATGGYSPTPVVTSPTVILDAIARERAHVLVLSHVSFATGQLMTRLPEIIAAAHEQSTLVLLDCYHSAGVVPVEFDTLGPDFAVGGSYKYTRGGPGACWLAVHPRHLSDRPHEGSPACPFLKPTLDTGWFAKLDTFKYERTERPRWTAGGDAWLESTPPILTAYQARSGLEFTLAVGVPRLREYSLAQQARLRKALIGRGVPTPLIEPHGAFVLVPHRHPPSAVRGLKAAGLNADARHSFVRLCPDVLTTDEEIDRAAEIIASVWNPSLSVHSRE